MHYFICAGAMGDSGVYAVKAMLECVNTVSCHTEMKRGKEESKNVLCSSTSHQVPNRHSSGNNDATAWTEAGT
jgi:hypothetical protein